MVAVEPDFVVETLAWCNEIRAAAGAPPLDRLPKGTREDPESCPCGKATGLYVETSTFGASKETRYDNLLPEAAAKFVRQFDMGALPEYDDKPIEEMDPWD